MALCRNWRPSGRFFVAQMQLKDSAERSNQCVISEQFTLIGEYRMKAREIMTPSPSCCSSDDSLKDVACIMRDQDCGAVPVTENGQLMGIITDRDLTVRALAVGKNADTRVGDIVTRDPSCCSADDDIRAVEKVMSERQVRRVPIVDGDGQCVGIVSQADLARAAMTGGRVSEHEVATVLESVSEPSR